MIYKGWKIVKKQNGFAVIDAKFGFEIKCKSLQACKIRISKLIATRIALNI